MRINTKSLFTLYLSIFTLFWALFALTNSGYDYSEGNYHYKIAENIIRTGHLGFDTPQSGIFTLAPNGKTYGSHEIGNTVFYIPTAFINILLENTLSRFVEPKNISILKEFIRSFQPGLYSAISLTAFFGILRVGFAQKIIPSFLATLSLGITTYFWTYTRESYDGVLCTMLLILSFLCLLIYKERNKMIYLLLAFFSLGFGFITRISMLLPIVVSLGYLVIISKSNLENKIKNIGVALLTVIPFFIWQSWYNHLRTGFFHLSPVQTDEKYKLINSLDGNIFVGLQGLLFSPGKSIFVYAPLLLLSLFLFKKFSREYQKEAMYVLFLTIAWFLLHSRLKSWYGAWGWGPRHLLPIIPILLLPFAVNIEYVIRRISLNISTILLASFGFILNLASIISSWYWRIILAKGANRLGDDVFIWSLPNSQPVDMFKGAAQNLLTSYRLATNSAIVKQSNLWYLHKGMTEYGSFTVNIWPNSIIFAGIYWYFVVPFVIILMILMYLSIKHILHLNKNSIIS